MSEATQVGLAAFATGQAPPMAVQNLSWWLAVFLIVRRRQPSEPSTQGELFEEH